MLIVVLITATVNFYYRHYNLLPAQCYRHSSIVCSLSQPISANYYRQLTQPSARYSQEYYLNNKFVVVLFVVSGALPITVAVQADKLDRWQRRSLLLRVRC